ncbi:MAG: isoamylase early set domain-containing protein [Thermodesulfobacteriota bacterium]
MARKKTRGEHIAKENAQAKGASFQFLAPDANEVFIAGGFNHWDKRASPLGKDKDGIWRISLPLMPGRYEYRFVADGTWENDPSCSDCVPNEFGSLNCVRIVE